MKRIIFVLLILGLIPFNALAEETAEERLQSVRFERIIDKIDLSLKAIDVRLNGMESSLRDKAIEMERRIGELNRLRQEVTEDRVSFVRKDAYDTKMEVRDKWVDEVNRKITILMVEYDRRITAAIIFSAIAAVVSLVNIFIAIRRKNG